MKTITFLKAIPYKALLYSPYVLLTLGSALNRIVIAANGGFMPVLVPGGCPTADGILDPIHSCLTATTHFKLLSDWLVYHSEISSLGDWLLDAGNFLGYPLIAAWVALVAKDLEYAKRFLLR